jgi:hypothetical protein
MAVLSSNALTLQDHAKRLDPDGKVPAIVELLAQSNEILDDMKFMEGNLPTGHRTTVRTGLPSVFWRLLNQGVQPSKSLTAQIDEQCGMMEAWSEVDEKVAKLNGNVNSFRLSEAQAFLEAMNQEKASTLFYGNSSLDPEEFNGFAVRYGDLSADNAQNIIDGGGVGSDNSSIWLIVWGDQTVHGIFPKGSKAGLDHEDLGLQTVQDAVGIAGSRLRAYQDRFTWECGLSVKDWRFAVRIANVDISNLVAKSSAADLIDLMIKALHRIPNMNMGSAAFYANRSVIQMLDIQRRDDVAGAGLRYENVDGKLIPHFRGGPIRKVDALVETEAQVV